MPLTLRELVATSLRDAPTLHDLGLPAPTANRPGGAVIQADTVDNVPVAIRPFIVLRWEVEQPGMGPYTFRPFFGLVYDVMGDFTRADSIGREMASILKTFEQVEVEGGWLMRIEGGTRDRDGKDEGYQCLVAPYAFRAVASGI